MISRYFPKEAVDIAAKSGFLSRKMWSEFVFKGGTSNWNYKLWKSLATRKYFQPHPSSHLQNIYVLNRSNKEVIEYLGGLATKAPSVSQMTHDELVLRGLLNAKNNGVFEHWTSEAELRAQGKSAFRIESQGQAIKYPDALISRKAGDSLQNLALEMELTLKSRKRYVQIMSAYAGLKDICGVVFVCKNITIEKAIQDVARQIYFPFRDRHLSFFSVEEWIKNSSAVLKKSYHG